MPGVPSKPPSLPDTVDATPSEILTRLEQRLLQIGSVWFPTPRELRGWSSSGVPLYVRILGPDRVEIGPRLASMWAACFAPVWRAHLQATGAGSSLRWRTGPVRFTLGLLLAWWAILVAWPVAPAASPDPEEASRWVVFWAFLAVASTVGPALGWLFGGQALQEARGWLLEALAQPHVDEDW